MIDTNHPDAKPADPSELSFEIDPYKAPFYKLMQRARGEDRWVEVGFVWAAGVNRLNGIENWWLYDVTRSDDKERQPYRWPGFTSEGFNEGTELKLEPQTPFGKESVSSLRSYLETNFGVRLTHVKAVIQEGR